MTTLDPTRATRLENARRNARRLAHEVLNPGERLIWSGYCQSKVGQQSKAAPGAEYGAILALIIFVLTIVGVGTVLNETFGISFGFVFGFVVAVLLLWKIGEDLRTGHDSKMYCRQQTIYALTNERALVFRNCNQGVPVRSVPWRFIDHVRVVGERWDGRGTVEFWSWDMSAQKWTCNLRFLMVKDPQQVVDWVEAVVTSRE
jgi:hypothetical protein